MAESITHSLDARADAGAMDDTTQPGPSGSRTRPGPAPVLGEIQGADPGGDRNRGMISTPNPSARPGEAQNGFDARENPHMATSAGSRVSRLQSFDHLRAPTLARPPGCSDRDVT